MPTPVRDGQNSFAGGINTVSDPIALSANQIRRAVNARINDYGAIEKRGGSVKVSSSAVTDVALNGTSWTQNSGNAYNFVVGNNGIMYYLQFASGSVLPGATWTAATWNAGSASPKSFSLTQTPSFCVFPDSTGAPCLFIADGDHLVHWNGTDLFREGSAGAAHSATYIKVHNQRIWGCGDSAYPDSIFYSKLNDGSSFGHAGGGQIVVQTYSNQKVVALASVGSSLLIFHTRGISRLTGFGQDDITVQPEGLSSQTGTIAPHSIVEADGAAFFVSDRGAFVATEGSVSQLGTPTTPDPLLPLVENISASGLANIRGVLSRRTQEIWWYVPGYGIYTYHLVLRAWSGPWTGEYLNTTALWNSPVNDEAELFVVRSDSDKSVRLCEYPGAYLDGCTLNVGGSVSSNGSAIEMGVQLRRMYFGDDTQAKAFRYGYGSAALASMASVVVTWRTNEGSSYTTFSSKKSGVWGTGVWDPYGAIWSAGGESDSYRIDMGGKGYWIDVTISSSEANTPVISRWQIDAFILGRR